MEKLQPESDSARCLNCGTPLVGEYCSACGQRVSDIRRPIRELLHDWLGGILSFDRRLIRTLIPLVRRPGLLTLEYLAGRRRRYLEPAKLYLALSVVLFLTLNLSGYSLVKVSSGSDESDEITQVSATSDSGELPEEEGSASVSPTGAGASPQVRADQDQDSIVRRSSEQLVDQYERDPRRFNQSFTQQLAKTVILLVPLFAFLLKIFYWRVLYVQHLILSLHIHAFGFITITIAITIDLLLGNPEGTIASFSNILILAHTFFALRRVYGQGRARTSLKLLSILLAYMLALLPTMALTVLLTTMIV